MENKEDRMKTTSVARETKSISVREATRTDVTFILDMIKELAAHEHSADEVVATEESLTKWLFDEPIAGCLIGSLDDTPQGIAFYFVNFSTWTGGPGFFLEDLIVSEGARGQGLGRALLQALAAKALDRGYPCLEWFCLDWNKPSLEFYRSLGAKVRADWIPHRLDGEALANLAKGA
ncbi:MAG: GNAT family N-acetyltransferase [Coriobacteriales bacterium]|jgi:GNAT superfamily N-acetyltransferase|nr:GNAT family N-acetyltransferase [Coriobacteriales bacterium]